MKINTVKEIREKSKEGINQETNEAEIKYPGRLTGYLVNNSIHVPIDQNNRLYKKIQKSNIPIQPAYTNEELLQFKINDLIQEAYREYYAKISEDVEYMGTVFQADKKSLELIAQVLSVGSVPDGFYWLDKYNNKVNMSYDQLKGLANIALLRGQQAFDELQNKKREIRENTTLE